MSSALDVSTNLAAWRPASIGASIGVRARRDEPSLKLDGLVGLQVHLRDADQFLVACALQ